MGVALKHEFAWSASRHRGFEQCRRAHYYAYYLSWNGWLRSAPPDRVEARTQHKLTSLSAVAGSAIHRVLAQTMSEPPDRRMKEDEAVDRATRELRQAFGESRDGLWKRNISKFTYLAEHFYEEDSVATREATAEYGGRFVERIRTSIHNFFEMAELAVVRDASGDQLIFVEDPSPSGGFDNFDYQGTKIFASPDLVVRDADGVARIYDWKTGSASRDDRFQLLTYAIQAREKWGFDPASVRVFDAYLSEGRIEEWEVNAEAVAEAEGTIAASVAAMRELHFEADTDVGDPENFPRIPLDDPRAGACRRCRFRRICGREG